VQVLRNALATSEQHCADRLETIRHLPSILRRRWLGAKSGE
jgi:hypothetical protein